MSDRIAGGVILLFSIWYGFEASRLELGFLSGGLTPRQWPYALAVAMAILAIIIIIRVDPEPDWPPLSKIVDILAVAISFVVYAYFLVIVGFLVATTIETSFLSHRFGAKPLQAVLVGVGASLLLYVIFVFGLGIPLPLGRIFGAR